MSQPTAGNFDCARLQEHKVRLAALVNPNEVKAAQYIPDWAPLKMLQSIQTVKFPDLLDPTKDNTYKAIWMDNCSDATPEDCDGDDCTISGPQIGTECKDFELTTCKQSEGFTVTEKKFRHLGNTVDMDEEITVNMAVQVKQLDEFWARQVVSTLQSMAGVNLNTSPYTVGADFTSIPATAWNPDLWGYFAVTKSRNKMPGMRLFLGGLMEQAFWNIAMSTSDPTGASAARKVNSLGEVFTDSFVTEDVLGKKAAFLVSPSALGIATKAYNTPYGAGLTVPVTGGAHQTRYTIKSPTTGIVYDAYYQFICEGNDLHHTWQLRTKGDVLTNAVFCNASRTGVLEFDCV